MVIHDIGRALPSALTVSALLALGLAGACSYDSDKRCGDTLVFDEDSERCLCPEGTSFTPEGCVDDAGASVGGATTTASSTSMTTTGSGGAAGETGSSTGGGPGGPPSGLGDACTTDADCAGKDAAYCDTFFNMTCHVVGCSVEPNDCYTGYVCCDATAFIGTTICVAEEDGCGP